MVNVYQEIIKCALVGTERLSFDSAAHFPELTAAKQTSETKFLSAAVAATMQQKAGRLPKTLSTETTISNSEQHPSAHYSSQLKQMLSGSYKEVLVEWLELVKKAGKILPAASLPNFLELGKTEKYREAILPLLGERGQWLAKQNPEWHWAIGVVDEDLWETGTAKERLELLRHLRKENPEAALTLLSSTWKTESVKDRLAFITALDTGLNPNDEGFLEKALKDKSKRVSEKVAELLATLPDSKLAKNLNTYTQELLTYSKGKLHINPKIINENNLSQYKISNDLQIATRQILVRTPPSNWCDRFNQVAEKLLNSAINNKEEVLLLEAWAEACVNFDDKLWARAFLKLPLDKLFHLADGTLEQLFNLLDPSEQDKILLTLKSAQFMDQRRQNQTSYEVIHILLSNTNPWGKELTKTILESTLKIITRAKKWPSYDWHNRLRDYTLKMEVNTAKTILESYLKKPPQDNAKWVTETLEKMLAVIEFRYKIQLDISN